MKKLLIVVDYQNDFVDGSLGFTKAVELEDYICNLINAFKENNNDVLFTFDTHLENYLTSQEGKNLPITHCIQNSKGWQLYGKVNNLRKKTDKQIIKFAFGSLELGIYLNEHPYDEITFVGVVSNICVISNAIIAKAALPEVIINIDCKGIASNDESLQEKALDIMKNLQMNIINKN